MQNSQRFPGINIPSAAKPAELISSNPYSLTQTGAQVTTTALSTGLNGHQQPTILPDAVDKNNSQLVAAINKSKVQQKTTPYLPPTFIPVVIPSSHPISPSVLPIVDPNNHHFTPRIIFNGEQMNRHLSPAIVPSIESRNRPLSAVILSNAEQEKRHISPISIPNVQQSFQHFTPPVIHNVVEPNNLHFTQNITSNAEPRIRRIKKSPSAVAVPVPKVAIPRESLDDSDDSFITVD